MLMRNSNTGAFEVYDIGNNQITFATSMGQVGLEWTVAGFGDFSGRAGETDMLMRNSNTGAFEVYDIANNAITSAAPMGQVGLEWQVAGFGDVSGNANETDMLMRNRITGAFEVYDISNNQITFATGMGQVGWEWTVADFGDFSGNANETDMLMRNRNTGAFEGYDISNNAITSAASMGQVGLEWQVAGSPVPAFLSGGGNGVNYTPQGAAVAIDAGLGVSDAESTTLAGATVAISVGFLAGDTLNFANQNGIAGSYNASTGRRPAARCRPISSPARLPLRFTHFPLSAIQMPAAKAPLSPASKPRARSLEIITTAAVRSTASLIAMAASRISAIFQGLLVQRPTLASSPASMTPVRSRDIIIPPSSTCSTTRGSSTIMAATVISSSPPAKPAAPSPQSTAPARSSGIITAVLSLERFSRRRASSFMPPAAATSSAIQVPAPAAISPTRRSAHLS
jgi:hypothetical protein